MYVVVVVVFVLRKGKKKKKRKEGKKEKNTRQSEERQSEQKKMNGSRCTYSIGREREMESRLVRQSVRRTYDGRRRTSD